MRLSKIQNSMNDSEISVMIGIHSYGTVHVETMFCLVNAIAALPYKKKFVIEKHAYAPYGKNRIIRKAIEGNFTHLIIVDGDMVFDPDAFVRLIDRNVDMVGANYNKREPGFKPIIRMKNEDGSLRVPSELPKEAMAKVFSVGGGFWCAKVSMLKQLDQPYFDMPFVNGVLYGDDVYFCKLINDAGFTVWCDTTMKLYHIGDYPY